MISTRSKQHLACKRFPDELFEDQVTQSPPICLQSDLNLHSPKLQLLYDEVVTGSENSLF